MHKQILIELRKHAPFTLFGAATGIIVMVVFKNIPSRLSYDIFYVLHPMHVVLSALVTASIYKLHKCKLTNRRCLRGECNFWMLIVIGYAGSIGIATVSDCLIPFFAEMLLDMPNRSVHIGFIEKWWLVNPLAILGVSIAYLRPTTKFPHLAHVLISTWASLFHIIMAMGGAIDWLYYVAIFILLFVTVWVPCCVSDIVFPLLFVKNNDNL